MYPSGNDPVFQRLLQHVDLATLIQTIIIEDPISEELRHIELVDCQGSDSLNPLDSASFESSLPRADLIIYVINSRLGVRQADRMLLQRLQRQGLTEQLLPVINVEAYTPYQSQEMQRDLNRIGVDFKRVLQLEGSSEASARIGRPIALCVLERLLQQTDPSEAQQVAALWSRQGDQAALEQLRGGYDLLLAELEKTRGVVGLDRSSFLKAEINRLDNLVGGLLSRDRLVVGKSAADLSMDEQHLTVERLLSGEFAGLKQKLFSLVNKAFDEQRNLIDSAAKTALQVAQDRLSKEVSTLNNTEPASLVDYLLAEVNGVWFEHNETIRLDLLQGLERQLYEAVEVLGERLFPLLPAGLIATSSHQAFRTALKQRLEEAIDQRPMPRILAPIVLDPLKRSRILGSLHSANLFSGLAGRWQQWRAGDQQIEQDHSLSGSAGAEQPGTQPIDLGKVRKVLRAISRQAAEDQQFSVSSARENFKFQFIAPVLKELKQSLQDLTTSPAKDAISREVHQSDLSASDDTRPLLTRQNRSDLEEFQRGLATLHAKLNG